jgi:hypothetical protein
MHLDPTKIMIILRYEAINESGGVHTYKIHGMEATKLESLKKLNM